MGLFVGSTPVKSVYVGSVPVAAVYVGADKIWPTDVVQITLGTEYEARDQLRAALADRGLDYQTVTAIPFGIELVGSGVAEHLFRDCAALTHAPPMDTSSVTSMRSMFYNCAALTSVPTMDTAQVTDMRYMFYGCPSLTYVPPMETSRVTVMNSMFSVCSSLTSAPAMDTSQVTDMSFMFNRCSLLTTVPPMDTSRVTNMSTMFQHCSSLASVPDMVTPQVTDAGWMFFNCAALTDGNARLIGRNSQVVTTSMIYGSGLTREPWYNADGTPLDPAEVHQVSVSGKSGTNTAHPLLTVTVPAGETWSVRVQGTMQSSFSGYNTNPQIRIGSSTSSRYGNNAAVDFSGTITSSNSTIALVTAGASWSGSAGFTGTVTIEK